MTTVGHWSGEKDRCLGNLKDPHDGDTKRKQSVRRAKTQQSMDETTTGITRKRSLTTK